MTYQEIFEAAVKMVCEETGSASANADYLERAPYLLAAYLNECDATEARYRQANGLEKRPPFDGIQITMSDEFLLSGRFTTPAVYYLSAMLVIDENEEMSDRFFSLYSDSLSSISNTLPGKIEALNDRYGLLGTT